MDVHELILSRVAPDALAKGLNKVLLSELQDVREQLEEAKSAFSKLKEVEKAVAQLQERNSDNRRSESLMKLMEETQCVDRKLLVELEQMIAATRKLDGDQTDELEANAPQIDDLSSATSILSKDATMQVKTSQIDEQPSTRSNFSKDMTMQIVKHAEWCLETITDEALDDLKAFDVGSIAIQKVLSTVQNIPPRSYDPVLVTRAVVELVEVYTERVKNVKLELKNLVPLMTLVRSLGKIILILPESKHVLSRFV